MSYTHTATILKKASLDAKKVLIRVGFNNLLNKIAFERLGMAFFVSLFDVHLNRKIKEITNLSGIHLFASFLQKKDQTDKRKVT